MVSIRRLALGFLMMKYGNGGACCSADNDKFMKALFNGDNDKAENLKHRITSDCMEAYERIEKEDYSELKESQRQKLKDISHWAKVVGEEEEDGEVDDKE